MDGNIWNSFVLYINEKITCKLKKNGKKFTLRNEVLMQTIRIKNDIHRYRIRIGFNIITVNFVV